MSIQVKVVRASTAYPQVGQVLIVEPTQRVKVFILKGYLKRIDVPVFDPVLLDEPVETPVLVEGLPDTAESIEDVTVTVAVDDVEGEIVNEDNEEAEDGALEVVEILDDEAPADDDKTDDEGDPFDV